MPICKEHLTLKLKRIKVLGVWLEPQHSQAEFEVSLAYIKLENSQDYLMILLRKKIGSLLGLERWLSRSECFEF